LGVDFCPLNVDREALDGSGTVHLETWMHQQYGPASKPRNGFCRNCFENRNGKWIWEVGTQSWTLMKMEKSLDEELPASTHRYLASLPSVLAIRVNRSTFHDFDGNYCHKYSYTAVDFPLAGLDVAGCFLPSCPPPAGMSTLYDLRFIGAYGGVEGATRSDLIAPTPAQMRASAAAGELRDFPEWSAYFGFAKSLVDERWHYTYAFDEERSPCSASFLDTARRASLNSVSLLVYVRRDAQ